MRFIILELVYVMDENGYLIYWSGIVGVEIVYICFIIDIFGVFVDLRFDFNEVRFYEFLSDGIIDEELVK